MKPTTIDLKNNVVRYYITVGAIWAAGVVFLIIFAFCVFQYFITRQLTEDSRSERNRLEGELSYLNITQEAIGDVDTYNNILIRLVPESEDYFSIIASLERLSIRTGLQISRYSITLPESGSDKYTMSIVGTIDQSQFPTFLQRYKYGSGRLVTIENMSVNSQKENNVRLTLNFYSRKVTTSSINRVGTLTSEDLDLMNDIVQRMTISGALEESSIQEITPENSSLPDPVEQTSEQ